MNLSLMIDRLMVPLSTGAFSLAIISTETVQPLLSHHSAFAVTARINNTLNAVIG